MGKKSKIVAIIICLNLVLGTAATLVGTQDSEAAEYDLSNPRVEDKTVTWDCVYFGNYWQNDTNGDGVADQNDKKEPIKWRVLSVDKDNVLLLADKILDCNFYSSGNYNDILLWLNGEFYNNCFTNEEKNSINPIYDSTDDICGKNVYLLGSEVTNTKYGFSSLEYEQDEARIADITEYAKNKSKTKYTNCWVFHANNRAVSSNGAIIMYNTYVGDTNIRPAINIELSSDCWKSAGKSYSTDNEELGTIGKPTPSTIPTNSKFATNLPINTTLTIPPTPTPTFRTITALTKPTKVSAKNKKKKSVTLSWKKVKGAVGYQIQYTTNKAFSNKSKLTKKTKLVIKKLKQKKTYSFRVRAYVLNGTKKVYGKWSTVKRVNIKK